MPAKQPKRKASNAQGCGCLVLLVVVVVIIVAVATGGGGSSGNAPKRFTVSDTSVATLTKNVIDNQSDSPGLHGSPSVDCDGRAQCQITYTVKEPAGISSNLELIDPTTQIWKGLFEDHDFRSGTILVKGPTTSVGGKSSESPLFSLSCDREANSQIDWSTVQASGLKQLCTFTQLVRGL